MSASFYPLRFHPILKERIWGGDRLREFFGRSIPGDRPIGESWELVDRPEDRSIVANGPMAGRTLGDLLSIWGKDLLGTAADHPERFPLMIKYIDAEQRLSLQVHPPPDVAARFGGEPKTEMWFVVGAENGARIFAGLRPGVTAKDLRERLGSDGVAELLTEYPSEPGRIFFLPAGTPHALDAGNVVVEIQQNSDTTYRLFDWNRVDENGRPRELHVEEGLASIRPSGGPILVDVEACDEPPGRCDSLVECPHFVVLRHRMPEGVHLLPPLPESFRVLIWISGKGSFRHAGTELPLEPGSLLLLPAALGETEIACESEEMEILQTRLPTP